MIEAHVSVGKLPEHSEFNPLKVMESKSVDIIDEKKRAYEVSEFLDLIKKWKIMS